MSYLGRGLEQVDNISKLDNITFNGGTTYALTKDSSAFTPISSNALLVSIDGVIQQGNFSVSGTNIVFNFSPTGSNTCDFIMHYGTGIAFTPADSSITKDKTNFISTSSSSGLQIKGDGTTDGTLQLNCSQNSHGVKIKSPAHSAGQSYTLTLPTTAPASNKIMQTDGSGNLSFIDTPSGKLVETGSLYSLSTNSTNTMIIDNCFTSSYNHYLVNFYCLPANDQAGFSMRYREAGGSPATESSANYYYASRYFNSGASLSDHYGQGATKIVLSDTVCSNTAKGGIWGTFNIRIDADKTNQCTFTMNGKYSCADSNTSTRIRNYYHGSFFNANNNTHAIAGGLFFFWEAGNTEEFNIKVYGYDGSNA